MLNKANMWRILVILAVGAVSATYGLAASARGLAVARAFQYGYDNPQPTLGEGPLGSSVYTGGGSGGYRGPIAVSGGVPSSESVLSNQVRSVQMYTPMAPVNLSPSNAGNLSGYQAYTNPVRELASILEEKDAEGMSIRSARLTTLAPKTPGVYREAMVQGEALFRQGKLQDAAAAFENARSLSKDSPESLLSLMHVYFAMGDKTYGKAADCLAKTLQGIPDLLMIRVRPVDFYGKAEDYAKNSAALNAYVAANPKDAPAMFLLGYIQYREGLMDKAAPTLKAVMALSPSREIADGVYALQDGITQMRQLIHADAPTIQKARDFAWAGISMGVPEGFKASPLTSPNQVLLGTVENPAKGDPYQVSLYAYSLGEGMSLKAFMDYMTDSLRQTPALKNMTTDAEVEVPFYTGRALVRVFTYEMGSAENKTSMGWIAFIPEPKEKNAPRIAYMLGVAMTEKQADQLLPVLVAVSKTITTAVPQCPAISAVVAKGSAIEDRQFGFSIIQPEGWAGRSTNKGYEMGQMDFARGVISPKVEVIAQSIPASFTPKTFGEQAAAKNAPKGFVRTILSQGPAKLDGMDGYQFVGSQKPEAGAAGTETILVGRLICLDTGNGSQMMFALVVNCGNVSPKDAEAFAETMASCFKLLR